MKRIARWPSVSSSLSVPAKGAAVFYLAIKIGVCVSPCQCSLKKTGKWFSDKPGVPLQPVPERMTGRETGIRLGMPLTSYSSHRWVSPLPGCHPSEDGNPGFASEFPPKACGNDTRGHVDFILWGVQPSKAQRIEEPDKAVMIPRLTPLASILD